MAVLQQSTRGGVKGPRIGRYAAVAVLAAVVGIGAGFGISRLGNAGDVTVYEGTAVARSVAMNENLNALIESAYAQQAGGLRAPGTSAGGVTYEGPAVKRSLAMNESLDALIKGAYAQQAGAIRSD